MMFNNMEAELKHKAETFEKIRQGYIKSQNICNTEDDIFLVFIIVMVAIGLLIGVYI